MMPGLVEDITGWHEEARGAGAPHAADSAGAHGGAAARSQSLRSGSPVVLARRRAPPFAAGPSYGAMINLVHARWANDGGEHAASLASTEPGVDLFSHVGQGRNIGRSEKPTSRRLHNATQAKYARSRDALIAQRASAARAHETGGKSRSDPSAMVRFQASELADSIRVSRDVPFVRREARRENDRAPLGATHAITLTATTRLASVDVITLEQPAKAGWSTTTIHPFVDPPRQTPNEVQQIPTTFLLPPPQASGSRPQTALSSSRRAAKSLRPRPMSAASVGDWGPWMGDEASVDFASSNAGQPVDRAVKQKASRPMITPPVGYRRRQQGQNSGNASWPTTSDLQIRSWSKAAAHEEWDLITIEASELSGDSLPVDSVPPELSKENMQSESLRSSVRAELSTESRRSTQSCRVRASDCNNELDSLSFSPPLISVRVSGNACARGSVSRRSAASARAQSKKSGVLSGGDGEVAGKLHIRGDNFTTVPASGTNDSHCQQAEQRYAADRRGTRSMEHNDQCHEGEVVEAENHTVIAHGMGSDCHTDNEPDEACRDGLSMWFDDAHSAHSNEEADGHGEVDGHCHALSVSLSKLPDHDPFLDSVFTSTDASRARLDSEVSGGPRPRRWESAGRALGLHDDPFFKMCFDFDSSLDGRPEMASARVPVGVDFLDFGQFQQKMAKRAQRATRQSQRQTRTQAIMLAKVSNSNRNLPYHSPFLEPKPSQDSREPKLSQDSRESISCGRAGVVVRRQHKGIGIETCDSDRVGCRRTVQKSDESAYRESSEVLTRAEKVREHDVGVRESARP